MGQWEPGKSYHCIIKNSFFFSIGFTSSTKLVDSRVSYKPSSHIQDRILSSEVSHVAGLCIASRDLPLDLPRLLGLCPFCTTRAVVWAFLGERTKKKIQSEKSNSKGTQSCWSKRVWGRKRKTGNEVKKSEKEKEEEKDNSIKTEQEGGKTNLSRQRSVIGGFCTP